MSSLGLENFFLCRLNCRTDASNLLKREHRCCALRFPRCCGGHRRAATIHPRRTKSRFFTGITFVFCGSLFSRAVEATKVPAPHNEKQRRTIVAFAVQLIDFLIACLSLRSLFQAPQISKAVNSAAVSIRPAWLQRITAHKIEAGELETLLGVAHLRSGDIAEHIRFATARCTWTCTPQRFEIEKRLLPVVPGNGKLIADLLNVCWLQAHVAILAGSVHIGNKRGGSTAPPGDVSSGAEGALFGIEQGTARSTYSRFGRVRSPKIAVPTRTSVAPSSTAIGKSFVIPMESCGSLRSNSFSYASRNSRNPTKYFRDASAFSASGGIIINPSMDNRGNARSSSICSRSFWGENPNLLPSPATLTSSKIRGCIPSSSAIRFISCASANESTLWINSNNGSACRILFFC